MPTAQAYLFVPRWLQYSAMALKVDRDTAERFAFYGRDAGKTLLAILLEHRRYFHRQHGNRTRLHRRSDRFRISPRVEMLIMYMYVGLAKKSSDVRRIEYESVCTLWCSIRDG